MIRMDRPKGADMRGVICAALGAALVLAGCGQATPAPGGSTTPAGSGGRSSAPAGPTHLGSATNDLVKGLRAASLGSAAQKITTEVPFVDTAPALTQGVATVRGQFLRGYAAGAQRQGLNLTWTLTATSADVIGFRLLAAHEGGAQVPASIWFDARTNRVVAAPGLVRPGSWQSFTDAVVAAANGHDQDRIRKALASDMAPRGTGPAIGFTTTGDLAVEFAGATVNDQATPVMVTVPGSAVNGMLSQLGDRARQATIAPSAFDPATVTTKPAPEPDLGSDPSAPASPSGSSSTKPSATANASTSATAPAGNDDRPTVGVVPDCRRLRCVAVTFDDGPMPSTSDVVAALTKAKVGATFFVLGEASQGNEAGVLATALAGMDIQSHTWRHDQMSRKADSGAAQARQQAEALKTIVGYQPWLVRPPYGDRNAKVLAALGQQGAAGAIWSIDTEDWKHRNPSIVTSRAIAATSGDIVLMHDIHPTTATAVPGILAALQKAGVTVVSMSELAQPGEWTAGVAWCKAPYRPSATC